jgi:murein DD-endopeptidase MepM/ murein hydrolase activator NlpD
VKQYNGGVRHDYKNSARFAPTARTRRWLPFAVGVALPLIGVALLLVDPVEQPRNAPSPQVAIGPREEQPPPAPPSMPVAAPVEQQPAAAAEPTAPIIEPLASVGPPVEAAVEPLGAMLDLVVERGDTLERLFRRNGLALTDLAEMIRLPDVAGYLKLLKPGDRLAIAHREGAVMSLNREIDEIKMLSVARGAAGFNATILERAVDVRTNSAHGSIESSLFEAGVDAGMPDKLTMAMAGIFQWDIDFIQDVREGDRFTVIYEELWRDGVKLRNGEVIAAEFVNQGRSYRAARYRNAAGHADYFTPEGRSMRKAFIRAPVEFTRISSNFNPNRRHPVLNTIRAHRGVDYAAPTGTPVYAAGDGKVIVRGVQGGYGNTVVLQHGSDITTLYGHLSRFGKPRVGSRVKQGDVIGYVGKSGLATGPHLHYEYRVNGVHRNPRTVPLPPADPVPAEYQDDFRTVTAALWRQLDLYPQSTVTTAAAQVGGSR